MEFFIIRDGQQTGPFNEETVRSLLKNGGLRAGDLGWRKGLPGWLPLGEVLEPGSERPSEPPPVNGMNSGLRARPATGRQKALLQFIGVHFSEEITRDEAALAISDAMENPKLTGRMARWGDEKLRLHPELFQEEVDYRRANRVAHYLELCQTDGAEVVKDVTKAHVQVLMESLDKRHSEWERDPRAALWDYLLPTVAEHFPQLVQEEWKGKLKLGGTSKVAAAYAGSAGVLTPEPASPGALQAAIRGVVYGVFTLAVVLAGIYLFRDRPTTDIARNESSPAEAKSPGEDAPALAEGTLVAGIMPVAAVAAPHPTDAPLLEVDPNLAANTPPAAPPAVAPVPAPTPAPTPADDEPGPAVKAMAAAATNFTPAPPPPGMTPEPPAPAPSAVAPAAPVAPATGEPVMRNSALLTQKVTVQAQFGKVTLPPGTQVRLIAIEGQNLRVNFNNSIVLIPVAATDIDPANTVVAAPPIAPAPMAIPPVAPTANLPVTPSSPNPLPSSDL